MAKMLMVTALSLVYSEWFNKFMKKAIIFVFNNVNYLAYGATYIYAKLNKVRQNI